MLSMSSHRYRPIRSSATLPTVVLDPLLRLCDAPFTSTMDLGLSRLGASSAFSLSLPLRNTASSYSFKNKHCSSSTCFFLIVI